MNTPSICEPKTPKLVPTQLQAEFERSHRKLFASVDADREARIWEVASHPFYLRIQQKWLRKLPYSERQDSLSNAVLMFVMRLRRNPTLGLSADQQHFLPAYVSQIARSIASSLYRTRKRRPSPKTLDPTLNAIEPSVTDSTISMMVEEFREILPEDEWYVCLFRYQMNWRREDVAVALGISVYRVRVAEANLRSRLASFNTTL